MLAAVLSDGTAVNIVKRGDDIITGGVHLPSLVDESGGRYLLWADVPVNGYGNVEGRYISIEDGLLSFASVVVPSAVYDGIIILFDCDSYEEIACPEALDWLCRNYGLPFSPYGLGLYQSSGLVLPWVAQSYDCDLALPNGVGIFIIGTEEDDTALEFPSGNSTVLGCDGSEKENTPGYTVLPSSLLSNVRSLSESERLAAYNTWLFYLASGLPKSVFEGI